MGCGRGRTRGASVNELRGDPVGWLKGSGDLVGAVCALDHVAAAAAYAVGRGERLWPPTDSKAKSLS